MILPFTEGLTPPIARVESDTQTETRTHIYIFRSVLKNSTKMTFYVRRSGVFFTQLPQALRRHKLRVDEEYLATLPPRRQVVTGQVY